MRFTEDATLVAAEPKTLGEAAAAGAVARGRRNQRGARRCGGGEGLKVHDDPEAAIDPERAPDDVDGRWRKPK